MLAYLAMFGYIHQENETPLSTAITGKQALLLFLFIFKPGSRLCNKHNTSDISISISSRKKEHVTFSCVFFLVHTCAISITQAT